MRNIRLIIEYDGTNYAGWQAQKRTADSGQRTAKVKTIQEIIENVLRRILQEKVRVIASGRTDAGVHAIAQTANFKTRSKLSPAKIQEALNALLPQDISVRKISEVSEDFHACYSAKSKCYRYLILNSKIRSVFLDKYSWRVPYTLNIKCMQDEAKVLLGRHDFKSFCASGSGVKTTVRTIGKISIKTMRYPLIAVDVEAEGFLYNMARNIVGTLVEIGRGRLQRGSLKKILLAKDRKLAGPTACAKGLFLLKVAY